MTNRLLFLNFLLTSTFVWAGTISKINQSITPFPGSTLYAPTDNKTHPAVIILHGSEGGSLPYFKQDAQFLASHGYVVLAFCWYNCLKDPITGAFSPLENVELRNTIKAIEWLKKLPAVGGKKVGLWGVSRGGEQAMIMGSLPDSIKILDAIATHTPSDVIVNGFNWSAMDRRCWVCTKFDLSCFNSNDDFNQWDWQNTHWNPSCGQYPKFPGEMNAWLLDGTPLKVGSVIEVEKFKKPIMITVGDQDQLWDYKQSVRIADRLKSFSQPVELHIFSGEHHSFSDKNENIRQEMLLEFFKRTIQ